MYTFLCTYQMSVFNFEVFLQKKEVLEQSLGAQ